jgi:hypothetical protein
LKLTIVASRDRFASIEGNDRVQVNVILAKPTNSAFVTIVWGGAVQHESGFYGHCRESIHQRHWRVAHRLGDGHAA